MSARRSYLSAGAARLPVTGRYITSALAQVGRALREAAGAAGGFRRSMCGALPQFEIYLRGLVTDPLPIVT